MLTVNEIIRHRLGMALHLILTLKILHIDSYCITLNQSTDGYEAESERPTSLIGLYEI